MRHLIGDFDAGPEVGCEEICSSPFLDNFRITNNWAVNAPKGRC
jgi:hypothetical protein